MSKIAYKSYDVGYNDGAAAERAAIVAWLNNESDEYSSAEAKLTRALAFAIERGEHLK